MEYSPVLTRHVPVLPRHLTAIRVFAAKDESRPVLNCVVVVFKKDDPDQKPVAVLATDSFRLASLGGLYGRRALDFNDDYAYTLIPGEVVDQVGKLAYKDDTCEITSDGKNLLVALVTRARRRVVIEHQQLQGAYVKYPDVSAVAKQAPVETGAVGLSAGLLSDVAKFQRKLGLDPYRSATPLVIQPTSGSLKPVCMTMLIRDEGYLSLLQMPIRFDDGTNKYQTGWNQ